MSAVSDTVKEKILVNIEIDGVALKAPRGSMIIEVTDAADIPIPRFCYHKKLSIAANCRMCLIEVEKVPKPLPACATPVSEGMKVFTKSPLAIEAQKGTMEFLLINHPLDCPICDQGGECELQEISIGYGSGHSEYSETKRVVKDKNLGPLISTEMTRCIHCTLCVRFGEEIAGIKELGATGRGEHMSIGTYIEKAVSSEMSGNVIDLCPVGALTSKPFRFTARAWEMTKAQSIAPHDCIGSNIIVNVRAGEVMRVDPNENEKINETWLSDRDRFSYEGLNSEERLLSPMIKKDGDWLQTDWQTALDVTVKGLKSVISNHNISQLGALLSPSSTLEELYLAQKLIRGMGGSNIDHRLRQQDFSDQDNAPNFPWLGQTVEELEQLDAVLLVGSNIRMDQPIASHRLRKAALRGARIMFVNTVDYDFNFPVHAKEITSVAGMEHALAGIAKSIIELTGAESPQGLDKLLADVTPSTNQKAIAAQLKSADKASVILGINAYTHPTYTTLRALADVIAKAANVTFGYLTDGNNSAGAWMAGAIPHRTTAGSADSNKGLNAKSMLDAMLKAYLLLNIEAEHDCGDSEVALKAMANAEFVVSLTPFRTSTIESYADVMLPITPFTETSGTFVNVEGVWQSFQGVATAQGDARPAWKVLRVLGNYLDLDGFDYVNSEDVREELAKTIAVSPPSNATQWVCPDKLSSESDNLKAGAEVSIYRVDNIVRRAASLQDAGKG